MPVSYKTRDGYRLGLWIANQRATKHEMDPERRQRLEELQGWSWRVRIINRIGSSWDEMYGRLIVFQRANGHCRVPKDYATDDGYRLGRWIGFQRRNSDNMDPERRQRLEGLSGWSWNTITDQWDTVSPV